jgi:hypothetical protein
MQLIVSSSRNTGSALLLEDGLFAGRRYRLEIRICQNPGCQCEQVGLHCLPETNDPT